MKKISYIEEKIKAKETFSIIYKEDFKNIPNCTEVLNKLVEKKILKKVYCKCCGNCLVQITGWYYSLTKLKKDTKWLKEDTECKSCKQDYGYFEKMEYEKIK